MFAILTHTLEIVTLGPDEQVFVSFPEEADYVQVYAGAWLLATIGGDVAAERRSSVARSLIEAIFLAIQTGQRAFDANAFIAAQA